MLKKIAALFLMVLSAHGVYADPLWTPFVEARGRYGDFRQGGGLDFFAPLHQGSGSLAFGQGRIYRMKRQFTAGAGGGYRMFLMPQLAAGINAFADFTRTDRGGHYGQVTVGGELFGPCWEARINGYYPFSTTRVHSTDIAKSSFISGLDIVNKLNETLREERAYRGVDGEVGYIHCIGPGWIRAYAGYFYFTTPRGNHFQGPHLRAYYEVDNFSTQGGRLFGGIEWQYDHVRKTQAALVIGLRVPLGCKNPPACYSSSLCRRFGDLVYREYGVTVVENTLDRCQEELEGHQAIFFDQQGGGDGTQQNPASLAQAIALSNDGDYLIALANTGNILVDTPIALQDGQTLSGFGGQKTIEIDLGDGFVLPITDLTGSGTAALEGTDFGGDIVTLANNNAIEGLRIVSGDAALRGVGITNVRGANLIIERPRFGIFLADVAGKQCFDQVFISRTSQNSVELTNNPGPFLFQNGAIRIGDGANISPLVAQNIGQIELLNNTISAFENVGLEGKAVSLTNVAGPALIKGNEFSQFQGQGPVHIIGFENTNLPAHLVVSNNQFTQPTNFLPLGSSVQVVLIGDVNGSQIDIKDGVSQGPAECGLIVELAGATNSDVRTQICNNRIEDADLGMNVASAGVNEGLKFDCHIMNNQITNAAEGAIFVGQFSVNAVTAQRVTGLIEKNKLSMVGRGIELGAQGSLVDDLVALTVKDNQIDNATLEAILAQNTGAGQFFPTLVDNGDEIMPPEPQPMVPAFSVRNNASAIPASSTMNTCATITGNCSNRNAPGISVVRDNSVDAGVLQVFMLNDLETLNNNLVVDRVGTLENTSSCDIPIH